MRRPATFDMLGAVALCAATVIGVQAQQPAGTGQAAAAGGGRGGGPDPGALSVRAATGAESRDDDSQRDHGGPDCSGGGAGSGVADPSGQHRGDRGEGPGARGRRTGPCERAGHRIRARAESPSAVERGSDRDLRSKRRRWRRWSWWPRWRRRRAGRRRTTTAPASFSCLTARL